MINISSGQPFFHMMAKPAGSVCNLDCKYCYYLEKEKLYPGHPRDHQMSDKMLESFIAQTIYSFNSPEIMFTWHGGEPLMRGIEFFEKIMHFQNKYGAGRMISNSIQTNGTLLTGEWCRFFKDHRFLVGLSVDGPEHIHDHYRMYRNQKGSFQHCMRGLELLVKHEIEFNTLTTVNNYNADFPLEVYRFLKSAGSHFMQFLPVVERIPSENSKEFFIRVSEWSVDPVGYGNFLIGIFDEWVRNDVGDYFVITFDSVLANRMGVPPPVCTAAEICGHAGIVEFNGDVYSCDHYVFPDYLLGNIGEKSLKTLMNDPAQTRFGRNKRDLLPAFCRKCHFLSVCNGECPKNRIRHTPDGEAGLNYLCPGFKNFYKATESSFDFMVNELRNHRPPSNVKKWIAGR